MIAFAACIGTPQKFAACAARGLERAMEPGSAFAELTTRTSIHEAYNEALEHFSAYDDLEALVLLHEDLELLDGDFCARVRRTLATPDVAIAGAIGARHVPGLAWWDGEQAGAAWEPRGALERGFANPVVDAVDGLLMVLSPWAVRNLRCDTTTFTGFHAYDLDLCFQARAAGKQVHVAEFHHFHHTKGGYGDVQAWLAADTAFRAKWSLAPRPAAAAA